MISAVGPSSRSLTAWLLAWLPSVTECSLERYDEINSFLLQLVCLWYFTRAIESKLRHFPKKTENAHIIEF